MGVAMDVPLSASSEQSLFVPCLHVPPGGRSFHHPTQCHMHSQVHECFAQITHVYEQGHLSSVCGHILLACKRLSVKCSSCVQPD